MTDAHKRKIIRSVVASATRRSATVPLTGRDKQIAEKARNILLASMRHYPMEEAGVDRLLENVEAK